MESTTDSMENTTDSMESTTDSINGVAESIDYDNGIHTPVMHLMEESS